MDTAAELMEKSPTPQREAATIVHRKLGTSKHFSESDKRDTAEIIVSGLESLRQEWHEETKRLEDQLEAAIVENQFKDALQSTVSAQVVDFVRCQGRRLETHAHDMTTTTELLLQLTDCPEKEPTLDYLEKLLVKTSKLLKNMDSISYEKEKCLRLLQLSEASDVPLDKALKARGCHVLAAEKNGSSLENSENLNETIDDLAKDSRELQEVAKECREDVATIRRKTEVADKEIVRLRLLLGTAHNF